MIKKEFGPFPTPHELNKWADQEPGSRDSVTKLVGQPSNKVRSISQSISAGGISKNRRKLGTGFVSSKKIKNLDIHRY
jgi:hypothetical protein